MYYIGLLILSGGVSVTSRHTVLKLKAKGATRKVPLGSQLSGDWQYRKLNRRARFE